MHQTQRVRTFGFLMSLLPLLALTAWGNEIPVLRAGAAMVDITPPLGELVVGGFVPFPANDIHDPLHARCLVLDDGKNRMAIVICDNLGIARSVYDEARSLISKNSKIPPDQILMAATHTHSATRAHEPKYRPKVVAGIATAVDTAIQNLVPAKIGWGGVDEPSEVFNRRWHVSQPDIARNPFGGVDAVRMNPPRANAALIKPAGPIDPEVSFLSVQTAKGQPLALLANYSLHYVGGVNKGDVSADYFAIFSQQIGKLLGADSVTPRFVWVMSNGTSGEINHINFRDGNARRYDRYEKMTEVANKVAKRVNEAHGKLQFSEDVKIGSLTRDLKLTMRKPDPKIKAWFREVMGKPDDAEKFHRYEQTYAARVQKLEDGPNEITVPLQVMRIGDLAIAAIPFETFAEIGLKIKDKSPFADTFIIELANDSRGYLPTPRQHELGGYETWMGTNRVQLDASDLITKTILEMMTQLNQN